MGGDTMYQVVLVQEKMKMRMVLHEGDFLDAALDAAMAAVFNPVQVGTVGLIEKKSGQQTLLFSVEIKV